MSFQLPRRVKDLPTLELDSDDEYNTPRKPQKATTKLERANESNKENEGIGRINSNYNMDSSTKNDVGFANFRIPKRRSELPALESDSEEDESVKDDNLNCAILNDSFIVSPGKSEQEYNESSASLKNSRVNFEVKAKVEKEQDPNGSMSFVKCFDKLTLHSNNSKKENTKDTPSSLQTSSQIITACPLQTIQEINKEGASGPVQRFNSESISQTKHKDLETPYKADTSATTTAEAQFATPQVRSFSVQRRPRDLCSTQSQKTRSAIVNEFRSQKVLFQTPMAMSRAPISCLPNDSITLSLCDTINEIGTPTTAEKTPQRAPEKVAATAKSKKSLDGAFSQVEKQAANNVAPVVKDNKTSSTAVASNESKETILHINNAAYAILKKLGCGGSSSVYLARRNDNGKEFALKVVDLRGDPAVVEGYLNETKLLAKLQGNVCVVSLFEYQLLQKESKLFVVMEKGDSDLHKTLQTYTTNLPLYVLMNYWYQMLQAVNYIHQNGVIHSDLKPANFLIVNGRLKLIDFGIASNIAIDSTSIIKFSQAGTFNYISPEALTDTSTGSSPMRNNQPKIKISTKSDVWSLGCILYLLLYKKTPFSHIKNIYAKISAISSPTYAIEYAAIPPYYPVMLVNMVQNCLQHNPKKRPACADLLKYPFQMIIPIHNLTVPPN